MGCLQGQVAIVTGASTGMGQAIAIAMATEGASLGLVARGAGRLEEAASAARMKGGQVLAFSGDVADNELAKRVVRTMIERFGRIDILVNNAGTNSYHRNLADTAVADWNQVFNTNITGAFLFTRQVLSHMRKAGKGQIINISSGAGLAPSAPAGVAYSASKQALHSLTGSINLEERRHGIRACVIAPGETIATPAVHLGHASGDLDATVQAMLRAVEDSGYYPCPSFGPFNPYQVEGPKTIVYELYEQREWTDLDAILVPTGSGCLLTGVWKGLQDLEALGFVRSYPRLVAVQPDGNRPLVKAIQEGLRFDQVNPEAYPKSVASGLLDPYPWDGDAALVAVRKTKGSGVAVNDEEILQAVRELAGYEGVFAEPSGAAGIAGLKRMISEGSVSKDDRVAVLVTGSGLKEPDKVIEMYPGSG
jgi:NAD(P)-dependent dehydrogenase (short-subunit alcohol dehydrogenase family)